MHDLKTLLAKFLETNSEASLQGSDEDGLVVRPWGDDTIEIPVKLGQTKLIESMNSVRLFPRFTAIWHMDTRDMEFIWGRVTKDNPYLSRSFDFTFKRKTYRCEFGPASQRLLSLAHAAKFPKPPGPTRHRNLMALLFPPSDLEPSSFWIRNIEADEEQMVEMAHNLNFYMIWYDSRTPFILLHEPTKAEAEPPSLPQLFPTMVSGRMLDPYMLLTWESARDTQEPFFRFMYYYQTLEYAAFYRVTDEVNARVKRLLVAPNAIANIDNTIHGIVDALVDMNLADEQKLAALLRDAVDPAAIWSAFEARLTYFSSPVKFEGGLVLQPVLKDKWTVDDFASGAFPTLHQHLRKIRNALAHGRERRMTEVIYPTKGNASLLEPWITPIRMMAGYAMLYKST